jgi:Kef-type K+ transport system membrane component KefB
MSLAKDRASVLRLLIFYGALTAAGIGCFFAIRAAGERLPRAEAANAPAGTAAASAAAQTAPAKKPVETLPWVLLVLAAVILTGRLFSYLLGWLGQPPVIGEVIAGIALGPSLLGWICQSAFGLETSSLLPRDVAPYLGLIAQLGVILYMFLVGLDFDASRLKAQAHAAVAISHASIIVPFLLGSLVALCLFTRLAPANVPFTSFSLFMGIALSVTAFPVLARILTDRGIAQTPLGVLALSCAAVDDVTAWCFLAFVAGVVKAEATGALNVILLSLAYVAVMLFVVRPLAGQLIARSSRSGLSPTAIAITFAALLLSALTTELIGIHAVFGSFLLGVVIPHDSRIAQSLKSGLEQVVLVLLLPAFFAYTGMRTEIGLVSGWQNWLICGLIVVVASVGKFGGTLVAARLTGLDWRTSSSLGILMNTRGLMELIVLNIGLDLGVISPPLFAMLVIMALVTTMVTSPLLSLFQSRAGAG